MTLKNIFSYQNLFQINTAFLSPQEKILFLVGVVAFLLSIIFRISASLAPNPIDKEFRHKLYRVFMFCGVGEMLWYLVRWQNVPFFGTHFISGAIFFIAFVWLIWIIATVIKNYSSKKEAWNKEQLKLKYLQK